MEENEMLTLEFDISQAEEGIVTVTQNLNGLKKIAGEIGTAFAKAFNPLINSMTAVEAGIYSMDTALSEVTAQLNLLTGQSPANQMLGDFSAVNQEMTTVNGLLAATLEGVVATIAGLGAGAVASAIGKLVVALGAALEIGTGGAAAIIAAVVASFAAVALLCATYEEEILQGFRNFISGAEEIWKSLYDNIIKPVMDFIGQTCDDLWQKHIKPLWDNICAAIAPIGESLSTIWNDVITPLVNWLVEVLGPTVITVIDAVVGAVGIVVGFVTDIVSSIVKALDGLLQFIAGVFTGDWTKAWEGIGKVFEGVLMFISGVVKGVFNVIILAINVFIGALYSVIAGVVNAIGGIVTVIGNIVGEDWGFSVPTNPPQIPYLAKGAVLPANKPFLAMVGDQRHGTNVEAPLATIQEAVALVMNDQVAAMMAGFEATVEEVRLLRQLVSGIEIGDKTIGQAARRYERKMAVVTGGRY